MQRKTDGLLAHSLAVQSYYFVPFESFLVATLLYWVLCGGIELLVRRGERAAALVRRGLA